LVSVPYNEVNRAQLEAKGQTTSHGFAVNLLVICWRLAADLLATQRICLQHVYSKSAACCRLAVDLSVLNHIEQICWRLTGDTTDLPATSPYVKMLQTNPLVAKCCRLAADLLAT
jgi:hypothetical protein